MTVAAGVLYALLRASVEEDTVDDYQLGGLVPPPTTWAELSTRVVFVPLGYGPAVAARAARLAVLHGVEAAEAYVNEAAARRPTPRDTDRRPPG